MSRAKRRFALRQRLASEGHPPALDLRPVKLSDHQMGNIFRVAAAQVLLEHFRAVASRQSEGDFEQQLQSMCDALSKGPVVLDEETMGQVKQGVPTWIHKSGTTFHDFDANQRVYAGRLSNLDLSGEFERRVEQGIEEYIGAGYHMNASFGHSGNKMAALLRSAYEHDLFVA